MFLELMMCYMRLNIALNLRDFFVFQRKDSNSMFLEIFQKMQLNG